MGKKKKWISLLNFYLIFLLSGAILAPKLILADDTQKQADDEILVQDLILEMAPHLKILKRKIVTYNYSDKSFNPDDVTKSLQDEKSIQRAEQARKSVESLGRGMMGNGLYSNFEPSGSFFFGFNLNVITYPSGGRLLDFRAPKCMGIEINSSKIKEKCRNPNHLASSGRYVFPKTGGMGIFIPNSSSCVNFMSQEVTDSCHKAFLEAAKRLSVDGVIYPYARPHPLCDNAKDKLEGTAFVALNLPINNENVKTLFNPMATSFADAKKIFTDYKANWDKGLTKEPFFNNHLGILLCDAKDENEVCLAKAESLLKKIEELENRMSPESLKEMKSLGLLHKAYERKEASNPEGSTEKDIEKFKEEAFDCSSKYQEDDKYSLNLKEVSELLMKNLNLKKTSGCE